MRPDGYYAAHRRERLAYAAEYRRLHRDDIARKRRAAPKPPRPVAALICLLCGSDYSAALHHAGDLCPCGSELYPVVKRDGEHFALVPLAGIAKEASLSAI